MKYENWSLGYWFVKPYIAFAHWLTHKKVFVLGDKYIPKNKPVIFAPNHQNALSDALAILTHIKHQPVWPGRAALFTPKFTRPILKFMKIMPIYRIRDGIGNLGKNNQTFAASIKVLQNNHALVLYPEAAHSGKRQMLPHKKAIPRIVFQAEEESNFKMDIQIVPVGIYYTHYFNFNRQIVIKFGAPISVLEYKELYKESPHKATFKLKNDIHEQITSLVVNINSKTYYEEFELIRNIYSSRFIQKQGKKTNLKNQPLAGQKIVNKLDLLEVSSPEKTEEICTKAKEYMALVKQLKLRDWLVKKQNYLAPVLLKSILLLFTLPLFIYGTLLNIIPFIFLDKIIKSKVKDWIFWSTFFFAAGILLFPLFYLIELLAFSTFLPGIWLKIGFLISAPIAGKLAFNWYVFLLKTIGQVRFMLLKKFKNTTFSQLLSKKERIVKFT